MVAELAGIVFVLFGSHAYGLIQQPGAISRFEMTYVMMVDTYLAPALDDPQAPFVMEQPVVLFVVSKAFFEHFVQDDFIRFWFSRPPLSLLTPICRLHEFGPDIAMCVGIFWLVSAWTVKDFMPHGALIIWWLFQHQALALGEQVVVP